MRVCLQRVRRAQVILPQTKLPDNSGVDGNEFKSIELQPVVAGSIESGMLVLLGVGNGDTEREAVFLAKKCCELRIFEDEAGKMNRSLLDTGGAMLVVSQFTLYADCRKGRRPSFTEAAVPDEADRLYRIFVEAVRKQGVTVATGVFRAEMHIELVNDGPVTIWLDTDQFSP